MDALRVAGPAGLARAPGERAAVPEALRPLDRAWHPGLSWLLTLRWFAVAGQLTLLVVARFAIGLKLDYGALFAMAGLTALTNAALHPAARRPGAERAIPLVLVVDTVVLAGMLVASGGPSNPFSVFFIVHVALGALLLESRGMWLLVGLTVVMFGSLFFASGAKGHVHDHHSGWSAHLVGMWIAYAFTSAFVAQLIAWISGAMRERDRTLARMTEQNERLATLSSFSANAAHELGTPLATISIAADELGRTLEGTESDTEARRDARLIADEVRRCRDILRTLSARAGESMGEMPVPVTRDAVASDLIAALPGIDPTRLKVRSSGDAAGAVVVPRRTLSQMVANLIENALRAHDELGVTDPVAVDVEWGDGLTVKVTDRGPGLPPAVSARLGDPFVTTRADSGGLGLGIYLARCFSERIGGRLEFASRPGGGTVATLFVPRDAAQGAYA